MTRSQTVSQPKSPNDARVAQAHAEAGHTEVTRRVSATLAAVFLAVLAIVPLTQIAIAPGIWRSENPATQRAVPDSTGTSHWRVRIMAANRGVLRSIQEFTDRLDNDSLSTRYLRPVVQLLMTRVARTGNERVYTGRGDWLHFAPDVHHVVGPGFLDDNQLALRSAEGDSLSDTPFADPRPALLAFHEALSRRDIDLVLMPTPVKPTIHPESLSSSAAETAVQNRSFRQFVDEMRSAGLLVFDPAPILTDLRASGTPVYLQHDTHWRPEAVIAVADALGSFLRQEISLSDGTGAFANRRVRSVSNQGDTAALLRLPERYSPFQTETVELRQIQAADGTPWRTSTSAEVLLLGDSFSNIYSLASLGWGEGAGLAEHLSASIGRAVDRLTQNNNGAFATREALARAVARAPNRLDHTRVVVYQFATRELSDGDWRPVDLDSASTTTAGPFLTPSPGQQMTIRGLVRQRAPVPRPGTVPYRDHIMAMEIELMDNEPVGGAGAAAHVYVSSMTDNVWTDAATINVGDVLVMTLRPWTEVAPDLDGITRSELTAGDAGFAEPWWGELAPQ